MKRVIRGGRVVDPSQGIDEDLDLLIEDGAVVRLGQGIDAAGSEVTDAEGLVVAPGFIDIHVHLREPGEEYKETLASGLRAAAAGGFTAVACLADTRPVNDQRAVTELILREAERHPYARVYPVGAISRGLAGKDLAEIGEVITAGAVALSDGGHPVMNTELMRRALQYTRHYSVPVIQRAEDLHLSADGVMHEGPWSTRLGLPGIPGLAEEVMVARDLLLSADTGGRYHVAQLSTGRSLDMVREAQRRGVSVTCEVSPHHLILTDQAVADSGFDPATKVAPPLRPQSDIESLREGLRDGTVSAIASGHAPHDRDSKGVQFSAAPFGMIGLETTVSLCLDRLVGEGIIDLQRLVDLLSTGPAKVLGVAGGTLAPGSPADITLLDLEREVTVNPQRFHSLSANSPFGGWRLRGAVAGTLLAGRPVEFSQT
jgi:dihydroorotase